MQGEFRARFRADTPEEEREQIEAFAFGIVLGNVAWFRRHLGEFPCCLGAAGIEYEDPPKCDVWCQYADTAPVMLERGRGTCIAIAAYEAGLHVLAGRDAQVIAVPMLDVVYNQPVPHQWHAIVLFADGLFYDPTFMLIENPDTCICALEERVA